MTEAGRRLLASVKVRRRLRTGRDGKQVPVEVLDFRLWDKLGALKLSLLHRGLLVNRHEHVGRVELVHTDDTEALQRRAAEVVE